VSVAAIRDPSKLTPKKVAHCSAVGKEDFDMYMDKMKQPPRSDEELKKLVPP
jgi:hypothetical protein